jgi:transposase-like protein
MAKKEIKKKTRDEFVNKDIFRKCPKCESEHITDTVGSLLDDPTVGMCLDCNTMWCLQCGTTFKPKQTACKHWKICNDCKLMDDEGFCDVPPWQCSTLNSWKKSNK